MRCPFFLGGSPCRSTQCSACRAVDSLLGSVSSSAGDGKTIPVSVVYLVALDYLVSLVYSLSPVNQKIEAT